MTIAPIIRTVEVKAGPSRAFELFTARMGDWWPRGRTIGKNPHALIVIEPQAGGDWFERDGAGVETRWGKVAIWEPPFRLVLVWQIDCQWSYNPLVQTEIELAFAPIEGGGTRVTLEHRRFESLGGEAARQREILDGGWPGMLSGFAALAAEAEAPTGDPGGPA